MARLAGRPAWIDGRIRAGMEAVGTADAVSEWKREIVLLIGATTALPGAERASSTIPKVKVTFGHYAPPLAMDPLIVLAIIYVPRKVPMPRINVV